MINEGIGWGEISSHWTLETTKTTQAKQKVTGNSISGCAKRAPIPKVSRSDTDENQGKENIHGVGLHTWQNK